MNLKLRWWKCNTQLLRFGVVAPAKIVFGYDLRVEGSLPEKRPVLLAPVHRTSIDIYAISYAIREMVSYVSTDSFGHSRFANAVQKQLTTALGSVVWEQNAISNERQRAVVLTRAVEQRLSEDLIVAVFTQGKYQPQAVDSIEDGLVGMLQRYETRYERQNGTKVQVPIVPVGIEYDFEGTGLQFAKTADRLARVIPMFPRWTVPSFGSNVTVRFGSPEYIDGRSPEAVTHSVMHKAAELSNIPFKVAT